MNFQNPSPESKKERLGEDRGRVCGKKDFEKTQEGTYASEELMLLNCGVGEDLESPLDCKEIQPVHPKGNQS